MRNFAFILIFASATCIAKPALTVLCEEPIGTRYDQVNGVVRIKTDGFTGVKPVFIFDDEKPKILTFIWGPAEWAQRELGVKPSAQEANIISSTEEKITAIRIEEGGVTHMYSLYPSRSLIFFTQHRFITLTGGVPTSSTFYAKCTFNRG